MTLPSELEDTQRSSREALNKDLKGELPLRYRRNLWTRMGSRQRNNDDSPCGVGWQRRTRLAILCAQYVLPIWHSIHPDNDGPEQMIALAEKLLQGDIERKAARRVRDKFDSEVDELLDEDREFAASYAGDTAVNAAVTAQVDEDISDYDEYEVDSDLQPDAWDAGYTAALAYAGGASWEQNASVERRREFWKWYVNEAVLQAYLSIV